jgi:Na+/melibiose symporter-like transporter
LGFREELQIFLEKLWPLFFRILYSCFGGLFVLVAEKIIEYVAHYFFPTGGFFPEWLVLLSNGAVLCTFLILLVKEVWEHMKS